MKYPLASKIIFNHGNPTIYMFIAATSIAVSGFFANLCLLNSLTLPIIVSFRFGIPLTILLVFFISQKRLSAVSAINIKAHIARAIALTISQILFFITIKKLSLSESMILYSTGPLFITLFDVITKNKIKTLTMLSLLFGALGVSFMLHIQNNIFNSYVLVGLGSGFCLSISQILLHQCARKENPEHVMLWVYLFTTVFSLLFLFIDHSPPTFSSSIYPYHILLFLLLVGIFSLLNQLFRGIAYSLVETSSSLAPIIYFSVLVSVTLDIFILNKIPDKQTIIGGVLTMFGSYLSIKNRR